MAEEAANLLVLKIWKKQQVATTAPAGYRSRDCDALHIFFTLSRQNIDFTLSLETFHKIFWYCMHCLVFVQSTISLKPSCC
jgi:hypothetical protein